VFVFFVQFESFCEIREEAPNYQRNYEFFVDRFTELCHNNSDTNKAKYEFKKKKHQCFIS
jgi:hypothetical protein